MEWLGAVRYWLAALLIATLAPAVLYWYLIHPFAAFWRRQGPVRTFVVMGGMFLGLAVVITLQHERLLAARYPFSWPLAAIGLVLYLIAAWLEVACRRYLKFSILAGLPEVGEDPGELLTEGIFGRVRNPRYLSLLFGIGGFSLILNYPALYIGYALFVPAIYGVILLEERELRQRFGGEYEDYTRRVPRLLPRLR